MPGAREPEPAGIVFGSPVRLVPGRPANECTHGARHPLLGFRRGGMACHAS